ncbi:MAG: cytochrome c [Steroidobacteraceae bacterium]
MRLPLRRFAARYAAALLLTAACARADDSTFTSTAGLSAAGGAQIYSHICQGCHMAHGEGAIGAGHYPKLASNPALASWQYVAQTVLGGRNGMPAFGLPADQVRETRAVHLSDEQVADVVNYIRSHFGNTYDLKVTAAQVAGLPHPAATAVD